MFAGALSFLRLVGPFGHANNFTKVKAPCEISLAVLCCSAPPFRGSQLSSNSQWKATKSQLFSTNDLGLSTVFKRGREAVYK